MYEQAIYHKTRTEYYHDHIPQFYAAFLPGCYLGHGLDVVKATALFLVEIMALKYFTKVDMIKIFLVVLIPTHTRTIFFRKSSWHMCCLSCTSKGLCKQTVLSALSARDPIAYSSS